VLAAVEAVSLPFHRRALEEGRYHALFAEDEGAVVAGGGVIVVDFLPHPRDPVPRRAWIVNVYTEPSHRRRGLARRIVEGLVTWCREEGMATVFLHASAEGRGLYEQLGFVAANEMRLDLGGTRETT
jgi:GNAT superfamily N-acetyltransferase